MDDPGFAREHLEIEKRRLELEEAKTRFDERFWHRNFGTMTTFAVAFLGVALSAAQVWVAYIEKDRQALQREQEIRLAEVRGNRELESQERRDLREFITKNAARVFSKDPTERDQMRELMLATFTAKVVQPIFENLLITAPAAQQDTWRGAREQATTAAREEAKPLVYVHYQEKADEQLAEGVVKALVSAGYRVSGKQLVVQKTSGDVRYFHSDEKDQAVLIAGKVHESLKQQGRDQVIAPLFAGQSFPNLPRGLFEVWIPARATP